MSTSHHYLRVSSTTYQLTRFIASNPFAAVFYPLLFHYGRWFWNRAGNLGAGFPGKQLLQESSGCSWYFPQEWTGPVGTVVGPSSIGNHFRCSTQAAKAAVALAGFILSKVPEGVEAAAVGAGA